jgi:hypothetical protein
MSELTRREFLAGAGASAAAAAACAVAATHAGAAVTTSRSTSTSRSIDRRALVRRHNPRGRIDDPFSALSVGNGEFAFTADVTGLQTFPEQYEKQFPLCTTAQWAWHTTPMPSHLHREDFRYQNWDTYGRAVPYATDKTGQEELFNWLRDNPHRLHLGRVGLVLPTQELKDVEQELDLWSGLIVSRLQVGGRAVRVETCCHPRLDVLAIRITSPLVREGLGVELRFPYGSPQRDMADWDSLAKHTTRVEGDRISRTLDDTTYRIAFGTNAKTKVDGHAIVFTADGDRLELCLHFSPKPVEAEVPSVDQVQAAAAAHWEKFWSDGGAIDLADSTHPQAAELERRIVLSQYNTAVHCAGSLPPAETGLLFNSWNGKFHLEMHWWHDVHFAAWNRFALLTKSLEFYERDLPIAREIAARQGYRGGRWPKMVGVDGRDSPSPVGPLLIWQQPHPIYYAELCYRHEPTRATLERWREIVETSAEFMASYAVLHDGRYVLGPPLKTVSENTDA